MRTRWLLFVLLMVWRITPSVGQVVKHSYRFYGNLSVATSECGPELTPEKALGSCTAAASGGDFRTDTLPFCGVRRTVYHNNLHWGLRYPNTAGTITDTYTIHLYVKTTDWGLTWARIIDFSNGQTDSGIYFKNTSGATDRCIDFYPSGIIGPCPFFNTSTYYLLTFTRNGATGKIDVYVNDRLFVSYNDNARRYVGTAGTPIYLFRDDRAVTCESGEANFAYVAFTNQYSTQTNVSAVYNDICTIANAPTADFAVTPNPSCSPAQNLTVTYTGDKLTPATDYTVSWNWDGGRVVSGSGLGPYVVNWPTAGTKNVTLTVKNNACGTPFTKTKAVNIGLLALSVSTQKGSCLGGSDGVISVTATNGTAPYRYSLDSVMYQSANRFAVTPQTYRVYVKDSANCVVSQDVTVGATDDMTLKTLSDTIVCQGQAVKLLTTSNATRFAWQPAIGLDNAASKDPVLTAIGSLSYVVTATQGVCTKKDTIQITVPPAARLAPASAPKACGVVSLSANSNGFVQWTGPGITNIQARQDTLSLRINGPTTFRVRASVLADGRCYVEKDVAVTSNAPPAYRLPNRQRTECAASVRLDAQATGVWDRFRWRLPNGTIVNQASITAQAAGTYIVLATSSSSGCDSQDTVTVSLGAPPPAPQVPNAAICAGEPMPTLTATGTGLIWYSDSARQTTVGTGATFRPAVSSAQAGTYVYYVAQTGSSTCVSPVTSVRVTIKPAPVVRLSAKRYVGCFSDQPADTLTLDAGPATGVTFRWEGPDGTLAGTSQRIPVQQPGQYVVRLTNDQQCTATDTAYVEEFCQPVVFAPDAFSPNGDNLNDVFAVKGRLPAGAVLSVYNRWGELIHTDNRASWDGTYRGNRCQAGVYTWEITVPASGGLADPPAYKKAGQVLLIR